MGVWLVLVNCGGFDVVLLMMWVGVRGLERKGVF